MITEKTLINGVGMAQASVAHLRDRSYPYLLLSRELGLPYWVVLSMANCSTEMSVWEWRASYLVNSRQCMMIWALHDMLEVKHGREKKS